MKSASRLSRAFFLAIGINFALHVVLRVWMSDVLELDEAEQILFGQWWQWGYSSQPPLYTWLLKVPMALLGPGPLVLSLLKNSLLFALLALVFLTARRLLRDECRAVLAALSLLLIPSIAWESARDLTHTVLTAVFVVLSTYQVLGLLEHPRARSYAAWGATLGLGMLAKYNFGLHFLALNGALLSIDAGRRVLLDRRMGISLLIALAIYAPHGLWQWQHAGTLENGLDKFSGREASKAVLSFRLLLDVAAYSVPVLLLGGLIFRGSWPREKADSAEGGLPTAGRTMLLRYFGLLLAVFLILIWSGGMGRTKVRWLYPFFSLFPVLAFAFLPRAAVTAGRLRLYAGFAGAAALAIFVALLVRVPGARWTGKPTDLNLPFSEFAAGLRQAGFTQGAIVGHNAHFAGNLRLQFGICCPSFAPHFDLPLEEAGHRDLLIVWETEKKTDPPARLTDFLRDRLHVDLNGKEVGKLSFPYRNTPGTLAGIAFAIIPNGAAEAPKAP